MHCSPALRRPAEAFVIASVDKLDAPPAPHALASRFFIREVGWTVVFLTSQHMSLYVMYQAIVHGIAPESCRIHVRMMCVQFGGMA